MRWGANKILVEIIIAVAHVIGVLVVYYLIYFLHIAWSQLGVMRRDRHFTQESMAQLHLSKYQIENPNTGSPEHIRILDWYSEQLAM
jgi:hypothetical protein